MERRQVSRRVTSADGVWLLGISVIFCWMYPILETNSQKKHLKKRPFFSQKRKESYSNHSIFRGANMLVSGRVPGYLPCHDLSR